jgi:stage II sporulation protein M
MMKKAINKKKTIKNESMKEQFGKAFSYLRESRNYIYAIALIFVCGLFIGFAYSDSFKFLDDFLKQLVSQIKGLNLMDTILFIFRNNMTSAFFGLFLGVILGIFPIMNVISNGIILGYVMKGVWIDSGISNFWRIFPHGIFELPAVFISLALGLKLGMFVFSKNPGREFLSRLKNSFIIFVVVVLPLLLVAAIIEGILIFLYKSP